jgi:tetratricopeptide (TPR) repeat protein
VAATAVETEAIALASFGWSEWTRLLYLVAPRTIWSTAPIPDVERTAGSSVSCRLRAPGKMPIARPMPKTTSASASTAVFRKLRLNRRSMCPPVAQHDLDRRGGGYREQRSEDPKERSPREDGDNRHDRIDSQRLAVDERLHDVVLEALPDDDERDPDDRRRREVDGHGREGHDDRIELIQTSVSDAEARGEGLALTVTEMLSGTLYLGLGRYDAALGAVRQAEYNEIGPAIWTLIELIEAAARSGEPQLAGHALELLVEKTHASGTDWALGIEARCRALFSDGDAAERLYREAIDRLSRARLRLQFARAAPPLRGVAAT